MATTNQSLLSIQLRNELDVVLAQRQARQCAQLTGLSVTAQTKFATAVGEISRNVIEHAGVGDVVFGLMQRESELPYLEAMVVDRGRGISNPDTWLTPQAPAMVKGRGLYHSRQLVDEFDLQTSAVLGTRVTLRQRLPDRYSTLSSALVQEWRHHLTQETSISPYEVLKGQNDQLLALYDELRQKNQLAEQQITIITRLNLELEKLNAANEDLLRERHERNQFLQHLNAELDAFAHTVSHDLKSPLYNIEGLTHLIEQDLASQDLDDVLHSVLLLRQQTDWMSRLIFGILNYSRAGRHGLPPAPVAVPRLVEEVVQSLLVPAGMQIHISPDMPTLLTQEIFLQQVFSNLISNAIKYHDEPAKGQVWVSARQTADQLAFTIADDGPGIPPEDQAGLFEIFQISSSRATIESTGVGLAIVRKIVHDKGGRVTVESRGRGASFTFTWPIEELISPSAPA